MTSDIFKNKYNSLGIKIVQTILCFSALLGILNRKVKNRDITSQATATFLASHSSFNVTFRSNNISHLD